jgi:hypothetical protein
MSSFELVGQPPPLRLGTDDQLVTRQAGNKDSRCLGPHERRRPAAIGATESSESVRMEGPLRRDRMCTPITVRSHRGLLHPGSNGLRIGHDPDRRRVTLVTGPSPCRQVEQGTRDSRGVSSGGQSIVRDAVLAPPEWSRLVPKQPDGSGGPALRARKWC